MLHLGERDEVIGYLLEGVVILCEHLTKPREASVLTASAHLVSQVEQPCYGPARHVCVLCVYMCLCVHVCVYMYVCMCVCLCVCVWVGVCSSDVRTLMQVHLDCTQYIQCTREKETRQCKCTHPKQNNEYIYMYMNRNMHGNSRAKKGDFTVGNHKAHLRSSTWLNMIIMLA